jgi:hypothetical protein
MVMTESWIKMRKAKENSYFEKKNKECLEKIRRRRLSGPLSSPETGEPMERSLYKNVEIERCPKTGGIWLREEQLREIIEASRREIETASWKDKLRFELV